MSTRTRYIFTLIVAAFGIYQLSIDNTVAGFIGLGLAVLLFLQGRKR